MVNPNPDLKSRNSQWICHFQGGGGFGWDGRGVWVGWEGGLGGVGGGSPDFGLHTSIHMTD